MTIGQIIVAIIAAILGTAGASFGFLQYLISRKDAKEEKTVQKQIDDSIEAIKEELKSKIIAECGEIGDGAIEKMKQEVKEEFEEGLRKRGEEGRERFIKNSEQIEANSKQINEILSIVKDQAQKYEVMAESLTSLNKVVTIAAESQRNSNYDRILMVMNTILRKQKMTITEKTNLRQLYNSWKDLKGYDPKIETMYEECMKLNPVPDEQVANY